MPLVINAGQLRFTNDPATVYGGATGCTMILVVKRNSTGSGTFFRLTSTGSNAGGIGSGAGDGLASAISVVAPTMNLLVADGWACIGLSKASGTVTPRFHKFVYSTGVATHENATGTEADGTAGGTRNIILGSSVAVGGSYAVAGVYNRVLSDSEFETVAQNVMAMKANNPAWGLWVLDGGLTDAEEFFNSSTYVSGTGSSIDTSSPIGYGGEAMLDSFIVAAPVGSVLAGIHVIVPPKQPKSYKGNVIGALGSGSGFVRNVGGLQLAGDGKPLGNPNYPCVSGPEVLPTDSALVPIDRGTEYLQDFPLPLTAVGAYPQYVVAGYEMNATRQQHSVAYDLYHRGNELPLDKPQLLHLPIYKVLNSATVSTTGGTFIDALSTPGGNQVIIDGSLVNPSLICYFDASEAYDNFPAGRVTRIGIRYLSWKTEFDQPTLQQGLDVSWTDLASLTLEKRYASWATLTYQSNAQYETRWLGEVNYVVPGKYNPWDKHPFTIDDLFRMRSGTEITAIKLVGADGWNGTDHITYLDFIEMVVEIVPERRTAAASRIVSNLSGSMFSPDYTNQNELRYALAGYSGVFLTGVAPDNLYTLAIREAIPADPSDRYRAAPYAQGFLFSDMEAIGPSIDLNAITVERDTLAGQIDTRVAPISDGVIVGAPTQFDSYILGAVIRDNNYLTSGAWYPGYERASFSMSTDVYDTQQAFQRILVDGSTTFRYIKLLAKPDAITTANLNIFIQDASGTISTVSITPASVRSLPDDGNGWHEFAVQLPSDITPLPGYVTVLFTSAAGASIAPWFIAGALSVGGQAWSGYDPSGDPTPGSIPDDLAVTLLCTPAAIPAPTAIVIQQSIFPSLDASCGQANIDFVHMTWASDAQYAEYAIGRQVDGIGPYEFIDVVANTGGLLSYDDLSAPWDVTIKYQLVGYRPADKLQITGAAMVAPVTTQSYGAVLGISDQGSAPTLMIYVPTGGPDGSSLSMDWTDLTTSEVVQLSGEDLQRGIHPAENRGMSVSLTVLIAHLSSCNPFFDGVGTSTIGAFSLNPSPYDDIREFARKAWVNVQFPGGMVRTMLLQLGPLTGRTSAGVYMAQLVLTDAKRIIRFAGGLI